MRIKFSFDKVDRFYNLQFCDTYDHRSVVCKIGWENVIWWQVWTRLTCGNVGKPGYLSGLGWRTLATKAKNNIQRRDRTEKESRVVFHLSPRTSPCCSCLLYLWFYSSSTQFPSMSPRLNPQQPNIVVTVIWWSMTTGLWNIIILKILTKEIDNFL